MAGINLPKGKSFLMVEETDIGKGFPFSAEKLSVTMTLYKYKEFADAIELINRAALQPPILLDKCDSIGKMLIDRKIG